MVTKAKPKAALQRRRFDLIKERVTISELQAELGIQWRKVGDRWRGQCPICLNGEHSDCFSAKERVFHCFACMEGGDVITLASKANDMPPQMACAWLGEKFGVDLPERPESWYHKQSRQEKLREQIEAHKREVKRRRLFKYLILPELEHVEPEADRIRETELAWERFQRLPLP